MLISRIGLRDASAPDRIRVAAEVSYDDRPGAPETAWFEFPATLADELSLAGDPWVVALLPLACRLGEPLCIDAPLDRRLHETLSELMEWWRYWYPAMAAVPVECTGLVGADGPPPGRTAQFFSGGVDSFFTLLRHDGADDPLRVDDLMVGFGFDIPLTEPAAFARVETALARVADRMGRTLIPFATNLRQVRFGSVPWGTIAHGPAMGAVALFLKARFRTVLIPSTDGYRETGPWGSHATTDHFFSASALRIIHDGAAHGRFAKTALVATSDAALESLRVCWRSQSDANCGRCEKCLRTLIALDLCGVLDRAATFPERRLDLDRVARIHCPPAAQGPLLLYYDEMLAEARRRDRGDLARALETAIRRSARRDPALRFIHRLNHVGGIGGAATALEEAWRRRLVT